jgi:hypothetical protein
MPDYSKGKIYKLTSSNSNDIYIGSTVLNLCKRKGHHISNYKGFLLNKKPYMTSFKIIELGGDIDICLLEEYPCNNKEQLHQRERFHIENNICVNKNIPSRPKNEYQKLYRELNKEKKKWYQNLYRELNKEKEKEYQKLYRELNKEKQREYMKIYYEKKKKGTEVDINI